MSLKCTQISEPGGRPEQQDAIGHRLAGPLLFAVVCDGLGGHVGGAQAASAAVETALAAFVANPAIETGALTGYLAAAHGRVRELQAQAPENGSMRTTMVALVTDGQQALWAHAGDSRLYHFRNGRILTRTRDHSVPQRLAEAGEIEPEQIRFHEDRNRLLRALGSPGDLKFTCSGMVGVRRGDAFLLATDGFWEWILENEMESLFAAEAALWLHAMEKLLLERATGDFDNYSALAVVAG